MKPKASRAVLLLLTLVCLALSRAGTAGELTLTRVFGPEVPTGPDKHPASMTELKNGDLYLVYYGGAGEYATDTAVFGSRLKKGETKWSDPKPIAHDPFRSVGNGVIWEAPDGVVWLFYVVRFGETWSNLRVQVKVSRDGAEFLVRRVRSLARRRNDGAQLADRPEERRLLASRLPRDRP